MLCRLLNSAKERMYMRLAETAIRQTNFEVAERVVRKSKSVFVFLIFVDYLNIFLFLNCFETETETLPTIVSILKNLGRKQCFAIEVCFLFIKNFLILPKNKEKIKEKITFFLIAKKKSTDDIEGLTGNQKEAPFSSSSSSSSSSSLPPTDLSPECTTANQLILTLNKWKRELLVRKKNCLLIFKILFSLTFSKVLFLFLFFSCFVFPFFLFPFFFFFF